MTVAPTVAGNGRADGAPLHATAHPTPVGRLMLVASPVGLRAVLWEGEDRRRVPLGPFVATDGEPAPGLLADTAGQLDEYFAGRRRRFDLPLDPVGTPFQRAAWGALTGIAYGTTTTYAEQAARLGDRRRARAVGAANGRNPLSIVLPCHRVVGGDGALTGFAGGLAAKRYLLDLEQA